MVKPLCLNLSLIILALGAGMGLCALAGWTIAGGDLIWAGLIAAVASVLGLLLPAVRKNADITQFLQMSLAGTVIHMFVFLAGGMAIYFSNRAVSISSLAAWLLGLYWITLAGLLIHLVPTIRRSGSAKI